jgi:hypothetical protein
VRQTRSEFSEAETVQSRALGTRRAGRRAFVSVHVLVPGDWPVKAGHDLVERLEERLRTALERTTGAVQTYAGCGGVGTGQGRRSRPCPLTSACDDGHGAQRPAAATVDLHR